MPARLAAGALVLSTGNTAAAARIDWNFNARTTYNRNTGCPDLD
jgi:hypothetical protein